MVKRAILGLLSALLGCVAVTAPAVAAGSITINHPDGGTVVVTIPDAVFAGQECLDIPVTAVFSNVPLRGDADFSYYPFLVATVKATKPGSSTSPITASADSLDGNKTVTENLSACPYSNTPGAYTAYVDFGLGATTVTGPGPINFTIAAAPTTVSVAAKARGSNVTVVGKATTIGKHGPEGVSGSYTVSIRVPKSKGGTGRWTILNDPYPDEFGSFKVTGSVKGRPVGSTVRVQVLCDPEYCQDVSKSTVVR